MKPLFFTLAVALAATSASSSANAQEAADDPATASPEVQPEPQPEPPQKRKIRFGARLAGGATYRTLYSSSITAGTIDLGLGVEVKPGALYGTLGIALGSTKYGLATQAYTFGPSWEFRLDRLRIGVGLQVGDIVIARVTEPGQAMTAFTAGAQFFLSVDVLTSGEHALYLGARLSADSVGSNDDSSAIVVGPTFFAGLRL